MRPDRSLFQKKTAVWIERAATPVLATLARLIFMAVLLNYFWTSGLTKIPDGLTNLFEPSSSGFGQVFPRVAETVDYDVRQATRYQRLVVLIGTWAEFILPFCIAVGLLTRAAASSLIVFVIVQSVTDITGHGTALGAFFDASPNTPLDQRALWLFLLTFLALRGGGPIAVDRLLFKNAPSPHPDARPR